MSGFICPVCYTRCESMSLLMMHHTQLHSEEQPSSKHEVGGLAMVLGCSACQPAPCPPREAVFRSPVTPRAPQARQLAREQSVRVGEEVVSRRRLRC